MSLFEIKAYKCEWCGKIFETNRNYHEIECLYDPKVRNCVTCLFSSEIKHNQDLKACYCPRADKLFKWPCDKYCPVYKQNPDYESYKTYAGQGGS